METLLSSFTSIFYHYHEDAIKFNHSQNIGGEKTGLLNFYYFTMLIISLQSSLCEHISSSNCFFHNPRRQAELLLVWRSDTMWVSLCFVCESVCCVQVCLGVQPFSGRLGVKGTSLCRCHLILPTLFPTTLQRRSQQQTGSPCSHER